jgi:death-on-curing protein
MNYLSLDEVFALHQKMIDVGGGQSGIHDFTLLHSAVERPKATFGGKDLYPTLWDKASALLHSLVKNHPFDDGNKRTAYYSTKRFLYINGYNLHPDVKTIVPYMISVDVDNIPREKIAKWLKSHCVKISTV